VEGTGGNRRVRGRENGKTFEGNEKGKMENGKCKIERLATNS